jgi:hypothetical protein
MKDFDGRVGLAFEPFLELVRVVGPSKHTIDFRVTASTEFLLPSIFVFVLLVPFSDFLFFRIFIFPIRFAHQY